MYMYVWTMDYILQIAIIQNNQKQIYGFVLII